jgi:hypothetical protein
MAISQSFDSWNKGKFKLNQGDIIRGTKSIFHSLRILLFALQIKEHGKIIDYSEANYYWQEINDCDEIKWNFFKDRFLPLKRDLEKMLVEG